MPERFRREEIMDMSSACSAPIQPAVSQNERQHPRYREYDSYRAAMNRQMVTGCSFARWLENTLERENGKEIVFHVEPGAQLSPGWYKNKFAPITERMTTFGPFDERHDAECA